MGPGLRRGDGVVIGLAYLLLTSASAPSPVAFDLITGDTLPPRLSDYRFFQGAKPAGEVVPYHLNTALFSDYADKERYFYVPPGRKLGYRADGVLDFPVGSALIKTFRFGAMKVETRVLLHRASGWIALPYVWQGSDAVLMRSGTRIDIPLHGTTISYKVPNTNQCKECHALDSALTPIGPKARNLNDGVQLAAWVKAGLLDHAPADAPRLARFDDAAAPVEARARAYLDVNCGHCHNPRGAASNSGLTLTWGATDPVALGIGKRPVAAGRGSGGYDFAIEPGAPERSIMVFRMQSVEPGVAMPELGRATVHAEAVKLLSAWIAGMPKV